MGSGGGVCRTGSGGGGTAASGFDAGSLPVEGVGAASLRCFSCSSSRCCSAMRHMSRVIWNCWRTSTIVKMAARRRTKRNSIREKALRTPDENRQYGGRVFGRWKRVGYGESLPKETRLGIKIFGCRHAGGQKRGNAFAKRQKNTSNWPFMRGILISFEGSDGCGKSTQIARLAERLRAAGLSVLTTREPGGTPAGESIRHLLQTAKEGAALTPETELLLFAASRAQLVREVIHPALEAGTWVLVDRFLDSTTVYQGVARRLKAGDVQAINEFAVGSLRPDLTFLFDLDTEVALQRLGARGGAGADRIENQPKAFFDAVRSGYLTLAAQEPGRFRVVDASPSIEAVTETLWKLLEEQFHGLFAGNRI